MFNYSFWFILVLKCNLFIMDKQPTLRQTFKNNSHQKYPKNNLQENLTQKIKPLKTLSAKENGNSVVKSIRRRDINTESIYATRPLMKIRNYLNLLNKTAHNYEFTNKYKDFLATSNRKEIDEIFKSTVDNVFEENKDTTPKTQKRFYVVTPDQNIDFYYVTRDQMHLNRDDSYFKTERLDQVINLKLRPVLQMTNIQLEN